MGKLLQITTFSEIESVAEEVASRIGCPDGLQMWWRGQADASWNLTPSSARHYSNLSHEYGANVYFQQKAGTRRASIPGKTANLDWMCLMQHYGHPTRLLDWTESFLIGLYFAVTGSSEGFLERDGALWAMNPALANKFSVGVQQVANSLNPEVQKIAAAGFGRVPDSASQFVAFAPDEFDLRMLAQHTMMTIHGGWPISSFLSLPNNEAYLQKINVPASAKPKLIRALSKIGVRRSNLFPDLQNLSAEIKGFTFD